MEAGSGGGGGGGGGRRDGTLALNLTLTLTLVRTPILARTLASTLTLVRWRPRSWETLLALLAYFLAGGSTGPRTVRACRWARARAGGQDKGPLTARMRPQ